jgi:hypothetical protein
MEIWDSIRFNLQKTSGPSVINYSKDITKNSWLECSEKQTNKKKNKKVSEKIWTTIKALGKLQVNVLRLNNLNAYF